MFSPRKANDIFWSTSRSHSIWEQQLRAVIEMALELLPLQFEVHSSAETIAVRSIWKSTTLLLTSGEQFVSWGLCRFLNCNAHFSGYNLQITQRRWAQRHYFGSEHFLILFFFPPLFVFFLIFQLLFSSPFSPYRLVYCRGTNPFATVKLKPTSTNDRSAPRLYRRWHLDPEINAFIRLNSSFFTLAESKSCVSMSRLFSLLHYFCRTK